MKSLGIQRKICLQKDKVGSGMVKRVERTPNSPSVALDKCPKVVFPQPEISNRTSESSLRQRNKHFACVFSPIVGFQAMAPNTKTHLGLIGLLLFFLSFLAVPSLAVSDSNTTVYEVLPQFGLPGGLLPDSVVNYTLSSDGRFVVYLANPCYVKFDYLVYYDETITGKLKYGSITGLKGIQVQRFFLWLDVDEIRVDLPPSDSIYFQVGFLNKKLDVDQFKSVHSCRDGVSGSCIKRFFQLPTPLLEIEMLLTE